MDFTKHFGLEYRGATLCAAVGAVMEKLLRPKRAAFSDKQRDEVYEAQEHRCAICDAELRGCAPVKTSTPSSSCASLGARFGSSVTLPRSS